MAESGRSDECVAGPRVAIRHAHCRGTKAVHKRSALCCNFRYGRAWNLLNRSPIADIV